MKQTFLPPIALALLLTSLPALAQTNFFKDTFSNGSTLTNATPQVPKTNAANYTLVSTKTWSPLPTMTANDFHYGIASSSSGVIESQCLFTTNSVVLTQPGDYIQLTVVFTNNTGILTTNCLMGFGLYSTGQTNPVVGGMQGSATSSGNQAGGANQWAGYVGQLGFNGGTSRIMTRAAQTSIAANDQDLIGSGSGTSTYNNPGAGTIGSTTNSTLILTNGNVYTEVLNITLLATGSEAITNTLYNGPNTNAPIMASYGAVSTNTTFMTSVFDGFAIGWRSTANNVVGTIIDISSILVSGQESPIPGPPLITVQPTPTVAATNGYAQFAVTAIGFDMTYQWYKNGAALANGGDLSGVTAATLVVSPCHSADAASVANGYYCKITGAGGFSTNTMTNSLVLYAPTNLTWTASAGNTWDLNNTVNFEDPSLNPQVFIGGDAVNFVDSANPPNKSISMTGNLGPSSMYVSTIQAFTFAGSGSIVGPCTMTLDGQGVGGETILNANNSYTGGTLFTNNAYVLLKNFAGLGTGPVTVNDAGGTLETSVGGSATVGINGAFNVLDDFTIQMDQTNTFAFVFLNDLSGTAGKTLTINPQNAGFTSRIRVYGTNTTFNANLVLDTVNSATSQALYNGTVLAPYEGSGSQVYNGVISGVGGVVQRGSATTTLNGQNTYSGGTFVTAGGLAFGVDSTPTSGTVTSGPIGTGPLFVTPEVGSGNGSGTVLAANGARTIANPIEYPTTTNNQTLVVGGTNNLTFTGTFALNGQNDTTSVVNRTVQANNTGVTIFAGAITDGGLGFGLVKTGTNALYLNGANTYTGITTNTAGLLAGSGSLTGPVIVTTNASIGGGSAASPGTLTLSGNLTLTNGNGFFRVNRSGTSDQVSVGGTLVAGGVGTINVTNVGTTLQPGDTFNIFNKAVTGGLTLNIAGGNVNWTNKLALNGSIQVLSSIANYPTNLTVTYNGTTLGISWPATHLGWILQSQTNNFNVGLNTNWVDVQNTAGTTAVNLTATTTNKTVFFRLRSPGP